MTLTAQPDAVLSHDQIAAALADRYGVPVAPAQIREFGNPDFKNDVADATRKFFVPCSDGAAGFMLLSGAGNPALVARSATHIAQARAMTSAPVAAAISPPVLTGDIAGLSFAVWLQARPMFTENKVIRRLRVLRYRKHILSWINDAVRDSLVPATSAQMRQDGFITPLQTLQDDSDMPDALRADAQAALQRLQTRDWQPKHGLQHGDFWRGNVMFPAQSDSTAQLSIIDWAGAVPLGYPGYDLARMLMSLNAPLRLRRQYLNQLAEIIGGTQDDILTSTLAGLGYMGQNLEHFPKPRYVQMSIRLVNTLRL